jgi:hypothetical protein
MFQLYQPNIPIKGKKKLKSWLSSLHSNPASFLESTAPLQYDFEAYTYLRTASVV